MQQQEEAAGSGAAPTGPVDHPITPSFADLSQAVRDVQQRMKRFDVQMGDVNFTMEHLPDVLGMVVEALADQCASQEDLGKLTTTTTGLQSSVDTLGVGLKSVQELLQQLLESQRPVPSKQPTTPQRFVPRMPAVELPMYKTGPVEPSAITAVLKADLDGAIKDFGPSWLVAQKEHWPANCYSSQMVKSIEDGTYGSEPILTPSRTASASVHAQPASALNGQGTKTTSGIPIPVSGVKAIKVTAPELAKFSRIHADCDVTDWLMQAEENCIAGQVDKSQYVLYAAGRLDGLPLQYWNARKSQARESGNLAEVYDWNNFVQWCESTLQSQDRVKVAFTSLRSLKQTSSVAEYKAKFDVLCIRAKIAPEQQLLYWYEGLKNEIVHKTEFDPVTRKPYASIDDAQSVALAVDTFFGGGSSHGSQLSQSHPKRGRDTGPANSGGDTPMRQAKQQRFKIQMPRQSRPTTQANGSLWFPLEGMVADRDLPEALQTFILTHQDPPEHCLKPSLERALGQCWVKGCQAQNHTWRRCPRMANYAIRYPTMDAPWPNDLVGPANANVQNNNNQNNNAQNFHGNRGNNRRDNYRGRGRGR